MTGVRWKRAHRVTIMNPYGGDASVIYDEEQVTQVGEAISAVPTRVLSTPFVPSQTIELIDPVTLTPMGQQMTMAQVYVAIASLYWKLAADQDGVQIGGTGE